MISTFISYLMIDWVFWTLNLILILVARNELKDEDDVWDWCALLVAIITAGLLYRYDSFRAFALTWRGAGWIVGGYAVAGGVTALAKWLIVLVDFRPKARAWLDANTDYQTKYPDKADALSRDLFGSGRDRVIESEGSFYPNWKRFPIAVWATYWPFFAFSVILDPITRAAKRAVKWMGTLFERLSKSFAVS